MASSVGEGFGGIEPIEIPSFLEGGRWGEELGREPGGTPEREELVGGLEGVHELEGGAGFGSEATGLDSEEAGRSPVGLPEKSEKWGGKETPSKIKSLPGRQKWEVGENTTSSEL